MDDAVRPSEERFNRVLCDSQCQWSSYLKDANTTPALPLDCVNLKRLVGRTPSFLGYGLLSEDDKPSFTCIEKESRKGHHGLLTSGRSVWTVSCEYCHLEPSAMSLDILLAVPNPLTVHICDSAPLAKWPGIQGILPEHDEGNYLTVLFLAWAYILSARWAESLKYSSEHRCTRKFKKKAGHPVVTSNQPHEFEIDMGADVDTEEASWWDAILSPDRGWEISTDYNQKTYLSPWSVSLSGKGGIGVTGRPSLADTVPPSSKTALEYLARFCSRYRLHGQCSAALAAALYIPFLSDRSASLPPPKQVTRSQPSKPVHSAHLSDIVLEHDRFLTHYMTLSCNVWGIRSLLCSSFFNAEIECNLVSAWLNPAFAIIDPLVKGENSSMLANILAKRHPRLGCLWLGAVLMGIAKSVLRDIRIGLTALELNAAGWTGTEQSFITGKPNISDGKIIRREDECRLLFITDCDGYTRPPLHPWKPFGETRLHDAELSVQQHACCNCHYLDYETWNWNLANGETLEDSGIATISLDAQTPIAHEPEDTAESHCGYGLSSQSTSEVATRGIFSWLRSTGYPANEKPIYQHSWIDIESSDDEWADDSEPDVEETDCRAFVNEWLSGVD